MTALTSESHKPRYAYGHLRVGILVPPGNSTVEPEMRRLLPAEITPYIARLPGKLIQGSTAAGLRQRIDGYIGALADVSGSFGGMALDQLLISHTGISYVVGDEGADQLREDLAQSGAQEVFLNTDAIHDVLKRLSVDRLGLVSPYPNWLERLAKQFWESKGYRVSVVSLGDEPSIYQVESETIRQALNRLSSVDIGAVLLSGTGLPTLRLLETESTEDFPVVSSNSCAAWFISSLCDELGLVVNPATAAITRWISTGT